MVALRPLTLGRYLSILGALGVSEGDSVDFADHDLAKVAHFLDEAVTPPANGFAWEWHEILGNEWAIRRKAAKVWDEFNLAAGRAVEVGNTWCEASVESVLAFFLPDDDEAEGTLELSMVSLMVGDFSALCSLDLVLAMLWMRGHGAVNQCSAENQKYVGANGRETESEELE